jgi:CRP-like cAMP-binding protein
MPAIGQARPVLATISHKEHAVEPPISIAGHKIDSTPDREAVFPILKQVTIFGGIPEPGIRKIYCKCPIIDYQTGDEIVREGTPATDIFIILYGRVKIVLNACEEPLELIEMGPGNCFGEASVVGIQDHSASVFAFEPSRLLVLSRRALMEIMEEDNKLFSLLVLNIARELARRLHHSDEILLHYSKKH